MQKAKETGSLARRSERQPVTAEITPFSATADRADLEDPLLRWAIQL
jgi:hypothetical protein